MRQKIKVVLIVNLLFFVLIGSLIDVEAVESQAADSPENDQSIMQTAGLLDLKLLTDTKMDATHSKLPDGRHKIILNYYGTGVLNVTLLGSTYMIFQLPPEIANATNGEIVATYDVPEIALLKDIKRKTGNFENTKIIENQVTLDFKSLISLNLLSSNYYKFTLEITMDHLPFSTSEAGQYTFYGEAVSEKLIDLSILSDTTPAKATIPYINIAAPVVNPVYSNHTTVSGTGESNKKVTVEINGELFYGNTDGSGEFSVNIPVQEAGTEISVFLSDENGYRSESTTVTVLEAVLKFHSVPETLAFQSTEISSKPTYIKREDSNWNIQVWDTRGEGSTWRLLAEATEPLTSVENPSHTLPNALINIDENKNEYSLTNGPVEVYKGTTGSQSIMSVHWSDNTGPFIYVHTSDVYAETYTTQITWTLVDAP